MACRPMRNLFLSFGLLSALFIAGCGSSTPGSTSVTCELNPGTAGHVCTSYTGPGVATTCPTGKSVSSCPTTNALGVCSFSISAGGITEAEATTYYSDGSLTAAQAQMACTAGGSSYTWKAN